MSENNGAIADGTESTPPPADDQASEADQDASAESDVDDDSAPDDDADDTDQAEETAGADKAQRDAVRYRRQLRATERRLQAQQQAVVDAVAQDRGIDARLLLAGGHTLASLADEHGVIDPAEVAAACDQVAAEFRISRPLAPNPQQGKPSDNSGIRSLGEFLRGR